MKTTNHKAFASPALKALFVVLALTITGPAFSQNVDFKDIKDGVASFSEQLAAALPLNSTLGLNWSDAYIGQFLGAPPHFGVGTSIGVSTIAVNDKVNDLMKNFGVDSPFGAVLPNPGYTLEGRIGGFVLPFDVGVKVGYLPPIGADSFQFKYFLVGGDIRYAILKDRLALPGLSVGLGVNYLSGGIVSKIGVQTFDVTNGGSTGTLTLNDPTLEFFWENLTVELKAQVSKSFILFTPYAGVGLNWAQTKAGYRADTKYTLSPGISGTDVEKQYGISFDGTEGFESVVEPDPGLGIRFFGGISFNMAVIRLDFTFFAGAGNFDFANMGYGGSVGVRFQL